MERTVEIKNWFDHKWLNFSGKSVIHFESGGLFERDASLQEEWRTKTTIPPFNHNRVLWEKFVRKKETGNKRFEKIMHTKRSSNDNIHNRIKDQNSRCQFIKIYLRFMNNNNNILNWLAVGISESPNSLNQYFYYDKSMNEFFSILILDYLMLDEDLNLAEDITTSYSESSERAIIDKIKRIENEDSKIIPIPRLTIKEREDLLVQYLESIDDPSEKDRIEKLYLNSEKTIFNRKFKIEGKIEITEGWDKFKNDSLFSKADTFINLNNINVQSARIMEIESEGNITMDLTNGEEGNT